MTQTRDLGRRVELVSMDPHFRNITIALYRQDREGRPHYLVHSYSHLPGVGERIEFVRRAAQIMGAVERVGEWLRFPCGSAHQTAARRVFLEACKLPSTAVAEVKSLSVLDKKSGRNVAVVNLGGGVYQVTADGPEDGRAARLEALAGGYRKLAEMTSVEGSPDRVAFPCGQSHDALVGPLLPRVLNVRAILREEETAATRGMLVAPSQQK
jgi:hypothetical protein